LGEELAIDLLKQGATDYVLKSRLPRLPGAVNRALREVEERKERERTQAELKRAESELLSHLRFFQNMDRINRAMQGTNDLEQMMGDVLDAMLSIFDCDRALLLYPCDPEAPSFEVMMERTRPEYPVQKSVIPMHPNAAGNFRLYLAASGAVTVGPGCDHPLEVSRFGQKSQIMVALYPKTDKPWVLGIHQCSYPRVWTPDEKKLLEEIARRMTDALTSLLSYRDLRESKAEIDRLRNYLSDIIDSMPSILVGMDNARAVTQWNRQAEVFAGIPAREAIGRPIADLLPGFASWIRTMGSDMDEHRPSSMEKLLIENEGERRFYDLMLYPLLVNSVGGGVLRIEDVTEKARIQELMVQTEKMMSVGGLAAGMAHEINNPLGIITQAVENIERRISPELPANRKVSEELGLNLERIRVYFDKRQISDFIASIRTASSRAAKIVANMLEFSRRTDTTIQPASLAQIVDQALELAASDYDLKKKYDFRSIDVIKDYQDMPQVPIVSVEIEQVMLNLLKNAAQAMIANPPDRKPGIILRLRREDRYAVLEVEDNGPGMTGDVLRRVFEPFFTTKEPGVGTGLGLSVSYTIVTQNHKGLMEVQSTPGTGTVFKVRLPLGGSTHE
jgi:PAS domain S-box-containing protein